MLNVLAPAELPVKDNHSILSDSATACGAEQPSWAQPNYRITSNNTLLFTEATAHQFSFEDNISLILSQQDLTSNLKDGGTWLWPNYSELCIYRATWLVQEKWHDLRWANQIFPEPARTIRKETDSVLLRFQVLWSKRVWNCWHLPLLPLERACLRMKSTQRHTETKRCILNDIMSRLSQFTSFKHSSYRRE